MAEPATAADYAAKWDEQIIAKVINGDHELTIIRSGSIACLGNLVVSFSIAETAFRIVFKDTDDRKKAIQFDIQGRNIECIALNLNQGGGFGLNYPVPVGNIGNRGLWVMLWFDYYEKLSTYKITYNWLAG